MLYSIWPRRSDDSSKSFSQRTQRPQRKNKNSSFSHDFSSRCSLCPCENPSVRDHKFGNFSPHHAPIAACRVSALYLLNMLQEIRIHANRFIFRCANG